MKRIHLFEFEDQTWFPDNLRTYGTEFLRFISNKTNGFKPAIPYLVKYLEKSGSHRIIDLASGAGGPMIGLNQQLIKIFPDLRITLSDFYPNKEALQFNADSATNIDFCSYSVNAMKVPEELKGLRTQFLSLHHFKKDDAVKILRNAVESKSAIAIFEGQDRSLPSLIAMLFSPLTVLFLTPMIKPFKWGRLLFTYLIPLVPLFVLWDGVVSSLRTYSVKEMEELIGLADPEKQYQWEYGRLKNGPAVMMYLCGASGN